MRGRNGFGISSNILKNSISLNKSIILLIMIDRFFTNQYYNECIIKLRMRYD
jgi:hypothetical protein